MAAVILIHADTGFFYILGGVRLNESLGTAASIDLLYQPRMIGDDDCGEIGGMKIGMGNRSTRRKPALVPLLSTINPTWLDPGLNPGRRSGKPATSRLSYGAALTQAYVVPTLRRHEKETKIWNEPLNLIFAKLRI
jgi:hypothetical protein